MDIEKFIGTWKLLSFESVLENGEITKTYGEKPVGFLVYTSEGHVQVAIMNESFPQEEVRPAAILDYLSYGGKFEVNGDIVLHHLIVASVPTWVGGIQERAFQFIDNNKLLLSTVSPITVMGQTFLTNDILWEKVDK